MDVDDDACGRERGVSVLFDFRLPAIIRYDARVNINKEMDGQLRF